MSTASERYKPSWMAMGLFSLVIIAAITVFIVRPDRQAAATAIHAERLRATNLNVVGGAIQVGSDLIKIANIDVGEPPPIAKCRRESEVALAAEARIASMLATPNAQITLLRDTQAKPDTYGRTLGRFHVNGVDVGASLLKAGLALPPRDNASAWCDA